MSPLDFFTLINRKTPVLAFALHDGHYVDDAWRDHLTLDEQGLAREEDPYTGYMISELPVTQVTVHTSRFQLDLNRTKAKAIYQKPEDAWGLTVWKDLPETRIEELHAKYDQFYEAVDKLLREVIAAYGCFFILDVHSYNHRRDHPLQQAPSSTHPEVNLGTAYNKDKWKGVCDRFTDVLAHQKVFNHTVDARQNVIFKGGAFAQWVIEKYGEYGAVLSVEFKKTFMDEWTGIADIPHINKLKDLLALSVSFLHKEIEKEKEDVK